MKMEGILIKNVFFYNGTKKGNDKLGSFIICKK